MADTTPKLPLRSESWIRSSVQDSAKGKDRTLSELWPQTQPPWDLTV